MKLLIEIDEHNKNVIDRFANGEGNDVLPVNIFLDLIESVENGTPIPDNAKNIDVLMTVFPKADIRFEGRNNELFGYIEFAGDWLDAPYKGGE